jgi:bacillithiol biosynthesis cysteine-adding enzyme BshC
MRLERYWWAPDQALTRNYIKDYASVSSLYEYDPWDERSEKRRADRLDAGGSLRADRDGLVRALRDYNAAVGNDRAFDAIESLRDPRTLAVVGGQQAGLFGGPLLVVYKAVTVIVEARRASQRLGRNVVPVFWIAGEDHDVDEVNHTYVLSDALAVQKIRLNASPERRTSVSRWHVPREAWDDALAQLEQTLMNTEFKPELMDRLRSIADASATLSEQFARTLAWLFGEYGLILIDSDDPAIRRLEAGMFREIVLRQNDLGTALLAAKQRMEQSGYSPKVELASDQAHLFVFHEGERKLLHRRGGLFVDRKETVALTESELLELAEREPERLSNNVMTRPLMQDYLLPVLSAVLGPSEIAYWGLLRDAFEAFGLNMPILVPRYEFTLLEGTVQKQMAKYGLAFEDVILRLEEKRSQWLEAQGALQIEELFASAKAKFADLYAPVVETVSAINPGLGKLGETNRQKIIEQIEFLEAKAVDAFRNQHDAALRQWERIRLSVVPNGKPQERVYNPFQYWVKYGGGWLRELVDMPLARDGHHRIVYF